MAPIVAWSTKGRSRMVTVGHPYGWFRNPANSPVEVGSLFIYHYLTRVFFTGDAGFLPSAVGVFLPCRETKNKPSHIHHVHPHQLPWTSYWGATTETRLISLIPHGFRANPMQPLSCRFVKGQKHLEIREFNSTIQFMIQKKNCLLPQFWNCIIQFVLHGLVDGILRVVLVSACVLGLFPLKKTQLRIFGNHGPTTQGSYNVEFGTQ